MHNCSSAILKAQLHGRAGSPLPAGLGPRSARAGAHALPFHAAVIANKRRADHLNSGGAIAELSRARIVLNIDEPNRSREKHRAIARGNP